MQSPIEKSRFISNGVYPAEKRNIKKTSGRNGIKDPFLFSTVTALCKDMGTPDGNFGAQGLTALLPSRELSEDAGQFLKTTAQPLYATPKTASVQSKDICDFDKCWEQSGPFASAVKTPKDGIQEAVAPLAKRRLFRDDVDQSGEKERVAASIHGGLSRSFEYQSGFCTPEFSSVNGKSQISSLISAYRVQNGMKGVPNMAIPDMVGGGSRASTPMNFFGNGRSMNSVCDLLPTAASVDRIVDNLLNCSQDLDGLATMANVACWMLDAKSPSTALAPVTPSRAPMPQIGEDAQSIGTEYFSKCYCFT